MSPMCDKLCGMACSRWHSLQVECGASHTMFLTGTGDVFVGVESHTPPKLARVALSDIVYVSCNSGSFLAQAADGAVHSWGRNDHGQVSCPLFHLSIIYSWKFLSRTFYSFHL